MLPKEEASGKQHTGLCATESLLVAMSVLSFKLLSHQKSTDVTGAQRVQDELVPQRLEPKCRIRSTWFLLLY